MKLNDSFEMIRDNILVMSPLPSISHAYRMLVQEENHKKVYQSVSVVDDVMACAANENSSLKGLILNHRRIMVRMTIKIDIFVIIVRYQDILFKGATRFMDIHRISRMRETGK